MAEQKVDVLITGGKATAAPPLGPALGPLGVNIGKVVADINKKTESMKGMQVPVSVIVNTDTKVYKIEIGTPPVSALIKKEAGVDKASSNPGSDFVADLKIEQIIKIAKIKEDVLLGTSLKEKIKEIAGSCVSLGVLIEGKNPKDALKYINKGVYDEKIKLEKTELSQEELKKLEVEKKKLLEEIEEKRSEYTKKAKEILDKYKNKAKSEIKNKMREAGIPEMIINEILPAEEKDKNKAKGK